VSPDNRYVLVANQGTEAKPSSTVSILDTKTFKVLRTLQTGKGPMASSSSRPCPRTQRVVRRCSTDAVTAGSGGEVR